MNLPQIQSSPQLTFVIVDLDRTLVQGDSYREMLRYLYLRDVPFLSPVVLFAGICRKLRWISLKRFKEISLLPFRGWLWGDIQSWGKQFYGKKISKMVSLQAKKAMERHRASNHKLILATGAPDIYIGAIASGFQFDHVICTRLQCENGRFTGKIQGEDCLGEEKWRQVLFYARKRGIDLNRAYFYTDHHSDLPLLNSVGNPCIVNPSPELKRYAASRNWPVFDWRIN